MRVNLLLPVQSTVTRDEKKRLDEAEERVKLLKELEFEDPGASPTRIALHTSVCSATKLHSRPIWTTSGAEESVSPASDQEIHQY